LAAVKKQGEAFLIEICKKNRVEFGPAARSSANAESNLNRVKRRRIKAEAKKNTNNAQSEFGVNSARSISLSRCSGHLIP